jgi:hypothetical protein
MDVIQHVGWLRAIIVNNSILESSRWTEFLALPIYLISFLSIDTRSSFFKIFFFHLTHRSNSYMADHKFRLSDHSVPNGSSPDCAMPHCSVPWQLSCRWSRAWWRVFCCYRLPEDHTFKLGMVIEMSVEGFKFGVFDLPELVKYRQMRYCVLQSPAHKQECQRWRTNPLFCCGTTRLCRWPFMLPFLNPSKVEETLPWIAANQHQGRSKTKPWDLTILRLEIVGVHELFA